MSELIFKNTHDCHIKNCGVKSQVYAECTSCKTRYFVTFNPDHKSTTPVIKCNGEYITICPYCRADSEPWTPGYMAFLKLQEQIYKDPGKCESVIHAEEQDDDTNTD